jgi:chromosome segregation protein
VEERLIPAIEAALGSALQAVIFKDPGVAESALATLSGKKLGRAAVIPVSWISSAGEKSLPLSEQTDESQQVPVPQRSIPFGVFGRASDCMKGDEESANLARRLLHDVLIVKNLETAFRMRPENPDFAFATLEGDFIDSFGIVHGGRSGENTGQSTLQRKIRIAELETSLAEATSRIESLAAARSAAVSAMDQATDRLKQAREAMQAAELKPLPSITSGATPSASLRMSKPNAPHSSVNPQTLKRDCAAASPNSANSKAASQRQPARSTASVPHASNPRPVSK